MEMIRQLLAKIRNTDATMTKKKKQLLIVFFVVAIISSFIVDYFLPFNYWINTLRAALSLFIGFTTFSILYIYSLNRADKIRNNPASDPYISFRDRFSYKQRVNLSIIVGGLLVILLPIYGKPSKIFTINSAIVILIIFAILSFVRGTRYEIEQASMGFKDSRDIQFEKRRKEIEEEKQKDIDIYAREVKKK